MDAGWVAMSHKRPTTRQTRREGVPVRIGSGGHAPTPPPPGTPGPPPPPPPPPPPVSSLPPPPPLNSPPFPDPPPPPPMTVPLVQSTDLVYLGGFKVPTVQFDSGGARVFYRSDTDT